MEILNTQTDIKVFPRISDYFSTVWNTCWFVKDHASLRNAKLQKYINFLQGKTRKWKEKKQHFKESFIDCIFEK